MRRFHDRLLHVENVIHHRLVAHSVGVLRVAVGAVFLGFGVLKFFPGVSPAENLTQATTDLLTFGLIPGSVSILAVATLECFIGVALIAGRFMRIAIWLLTIQFVGILSPLVLLPDRLFAGPHNAPTLEGQYVLKDIILVGAAMVIAAATFRGGRLIRGDLPPTGRIRAGAPLDSEQKLRLLLEGGGDQRLTSQLLAQHGISEAEFQHWRDIARTGASRALTDHADRAR